MKSISITSKKNRSYALIGAVFGVIYIILLLIANDFKMTNFNGLLRIICVSVIVFYLFLGQLSPVTLLAFLGLVFLDFKSLFREIIIQDASWSALVTYFAGALLGTISLYSMTSCLQNDGVVSNNIINVIVGVSIISIIIAFIVAGYQANIFIKMSVGISLLLYLVLAPLCLSILLILITMFTMLWLNNNEKNVSVETKPSGNMSDLDMLLKYKELQDEGIITEEEFVLKKEELFK